jgi:hypothetical protein
MHYTIFTFLWFVAQMCLSPSELSLILVRCIHHPNLQAGCCTVLYLFMSVVSSGKHLHRCINIDLREKCQLSLWSCPKCVHWPRTCKSWILDHEVVTGERFGQFVTTTSLFLQITRYMFVSFNYYVLYLTYYDLRKSQKSQLVFISSHCRIILLLQSLAFTSEPLPATLDTVASPSSTSYRWGGRPLPLASWK